MTGWNLPPGCNVSDIPGNSESDVLFEHVMEETCEKCGLSEQDCPYVMEEGICSMVSKAFTIRGDDR